MNSYCLHENLLFHSLVDRSFKRTLTRQFTLNTSCTQMIVVVSRILNMFLFVKKVHFEACYIYFHLKPCLFILKPMPYFLSLPLKKLEPYTNFLEPSPIFFKPPLSFIKPPTIIFGA